jgi:hypothetical protein
MARVHPVRAAGMMIGGSPPQRAPARADQDAATGSRRAGARA